VRNFFLFLPETHCFLSITVVTVTFGGIEEVSQRQIYSRILFILYDTVITQMSESYEASMDILDHTMGDLNNYYIFSQPCRDILHKIHRIMHTVKYQLFITTYVTLLKTIMSNPERLNHWHIIHMPITCKHFVMSKSIKRAVKAFRNTSYSI
jgi:hypothetical protein